MLLSSRSAGSRAGCLAVVIMSFQLNGFAKTYSGIEYSRPNGQSLLLDASIPVGDGPFPAAIIVHGGAWVTGDRNHSVRPLFEPISHAGIAWFSISYRLAESADASSLASALMSASVVNNAVDDVRQAISYVRLHAAEYKVDPGKIALIGESAGGQLASMAALKPGAQPPVQAVVAFYSPSDLAAIVKSSPRIPAAVRNQLKGTPFEQMLMNVLRELSPITWAHPDAPAFLLIHGTNDAVVPYQQSVDMCKALQDVNTPCELIPVVGGAHGLRWWESAEPQTAYKTAMASWLQKQLNQP